ncbi:MAG: hypothetical protein ACK4RM_05410 [Flavobacterium sp.]
MEELDILKQDWKKRGNEFRQYNEKDIYEMLHKKSSSIVKWIFIISVLELFLWIALSMIMKHTGTLDEFKSFDRFNFMTISEVISYMIIVFFIVLFYINYNKINTTSSVNELIKSIIRTRKTVQAYIKIVIGYTIVTTFLVFWIQMNYDEKFIEMNQNMIRNGNENFFYLTMFVSVLILLAIFVVLLWVFYKIIYGILLKRLFKNYEELKKIDY